MPDILVKGQWAERDVQIVLSGNSYSPPEVVKKYIQERWLVKLEQYPRMFNGPLVRLEKWEADTMLRITVGLTDFASYMVTREPNFAQLFSGQERANPQGTNVILITSDDKVLVTKRSEKSEQNPGTLNFIGGYINVPAGNVSTISVGDEVRREVLEELNIAPDRHESITVQGIGYDPIHCHPELFIMSKLSKSSQEILSDWNRAQDAHESERVFFVDKKDLIDGRVPDMLGLPTCWSFQTGLMLFK